MSRFNPTIIAILAAAILGLAGTAVAFAPTGTVAVATSNSLCQLNMLHTDSGGDAFVELLCSTDVGEVNIAPDLEPCTFTASTAKAARTSFAGSTYPEDGPAITVIGLAADAQFCSELSQVWIP